MRFTYVQRKSVVIGSAIHYALAGVTVLSEPRIQAPNETVIAPSVHLESHDEGHQDDHRPVTFRVPTVAASSTSAPARFVSGYTLDMSRWPPELRILRSTSSLLRCIVIE